MALGTEHPDPIGQPETDAYLDAMFEFLCRDASMNPLGLDRVFPSTYLSTSALVCRRLGNFKAILLAESPVPFLRRNLFVSANAIHRV